MVTPNPTQDQSPTTTPTPFPTWQAYPITAITLTTLLGLTLGQSLNHSLDHLPLLNTTLLLLIAILTTLAYAFRRKPLFAALAIFCIAAAWLDLRTNTTTPRDIAQFIPASNVVAPERQLIKLRGHVIEPVYIREAQTGPLGNHSYEPPVTKFGLQLDSAWQAPDSTDSSHWQPIAGKLAATLLQADPNLHAGQPIEVVGWLTPLTPPGNPGQFDFRQARLNQGFRGQLTLENRGNWSLLNNENNPSRFNFIAGINHFRSDVASRAAQSLRLGMDEQSEALTLLEMLLLGRYRPDAAEMRHAFREVGLAHILSISGAHLGILLGLVWLVGRALVPNPPRVAVLVGAILVLYMLAVPWRVPIVRAAIMAAVFCVGVGSGRRLRGIELLSLAALIVLAWRPGDLFEAGFQLSFGAVAGMILSTQRISEIIYPPDVIVTDVLRPERWAARWGADIVAVSVVAFLVTVPLTIYHFGMLASYAILLSVLALFPLMAVLGVGFLKIILGLAWPSLGILFSGPLTWLADMLINLVDLANTWPANNIEFWSPIHPLWVLLTLTSLVILLGNAIRLVPRQRLAAGVGSLLLLVSILWLAVGEYQHRTQPQRQASLLQWHILSVGDGNCQILMTPGSSNTPPQAIMIDCGSAGFFDVGARVAVPVLQHLGIRELDAVVITHADTDHFAGVLDVVKEVPVKRIYAPPQFLAEAQALPRGAVGRLVQGLDELGFSITPMHMGDQLTLNSQTTTIPIDILWPPADYEAKTANDTSLVLKITTPNHRLLSNGDIAQAATLELLKRHETGDIDLTASITDLPHHGSVVRATADWLATVDPQITLQSAGFRRYQRNNDPGRIGEILDQFPDIKPLVTLPSGMITVDLHHDGTITISSFRE